MEPPIIPVTAPHRINLKEQVLEVVKQPIKQATHQELLHKEQPNKMELNKIPPNKHQMELLTHPALPEQQIRIQHKGLLKIIQIPLAQLQEIQAVYPGCKIYLT